jgi:Ca2+-binding EF-hand superfamily protein
MLSYNSRHLLKELLIQIGQQERQLEVVRQILCEQPEFEPYTAFRRIDRLRKGFITSTDIFDFLLSNEFKCSEAECTYYINHYDRDFDNRLAYSEYLYSLYRLY